MLNRCARNLVLFLMALVPVAAAQAATLVLEPSAPWNLDYSEDSCRLARPFGTEAKQVLLILESFAPDRTVDARVIGKSLAGDGNLYQPVTFGFGPDRPLVKKDEAVSGNIGPDKVPMLLLGELDLLNRTYHDAKGSGPTAEQEAATSEFEIRMRITHLLLKTGSFKAPMEALRQCTGDLVKAWGLNPAQQERRRSAPAPLGKPGNWVTSNDYPSAALSKGESAWVNFRLLVDATGKATACHIQLATKSPALKDLTCKLLLARAQFKPAIGEDGQPIASYYRNAVRWMASR